MNGRPNWLETWGYGVPSPLEVSQPNEEHLPNEKLVKEVLQNRLNAGVKIIAEAQSKLAALRPDYKVVLVESATEGHVEKERQMKLLTRIFNKLRKIFRK